MRCPVRERSLLVMAGLVVAATLSGCAETTLVRSYPPGSRLFINDSFVGVTPVGLRVPRSEARGDFRVRVERPGYLPAEGALERETCPGRLAGAIASVGVLLLFRDVDCFRAIHDFALVELDDPEPEVEAPPLSVEARLKRIETLHRSGVLSGEEFHRYREMILRDL